MTTAIERESFVLQFGFALLSSSYELLTCACYYYPITRRLLRPFQSALLGDCSGLRLFFQFYPFTEEYHFNTSSTGIS